MPVIRLHKSFPKKLQKFTKNNINRSLAVKEALRRFQVDPNHPSLHLEKLSGSSIWTIRLDGGDRLFFIWSNTGDTAIFFLVGPHDAYRKLGN